MVLAVTIGQFFANLFNQGLAPALYAIAGFFFSWGCINLMLPGVRHQENAKADIYRVLGGLSLALLTTVIMGLIQGAAGGTPQLTPTPPKP